jgi:hypothetical protein
VSTSCPGGLEKLPAAERDRMLLAALQTGQNLHPACTSVEEQYKVRNESEPQQRMKPGI